MTPFKANVMSIEVGVADRDAADRIAREITGDDAPEPGKGKDVLDGVTVAYLRAFEPEPSSLAAGVWVDFAVQHKGAASAESIGEWLVGKLEAHREEITLRIDTQDVTVAEEDIVKAVSDAIEGRSLV